MDAQRNWNTFGSAASMPPIDTERWKYPAGACGRALAHVSTDERVRSHVSGVTLDTVCPGASCTTWSLDSLWQSVERHHAALPGICIAFMLTDSRAPLVLLIGAGVISSTLSVMLQQLQPDW